MHGTFTGAVLPPRGSAFALTDSTVKSAQFAVAPDGRSLVFVATTAGVRALWLQELRSTGARLLPGTSGASYPFWSPDGQFVGFFADGFLKKVSLAGRSPQIVCRAENGRGGAWSSDDRIVFAADAAVVALDRECDRRGAQSVHRKGCDITSRTAGRRCCLTATCCCSSEATTRVCEVYTSRRSRARTSCVSFAPPTRAVQAAAGQLLFVLEGELVAQPLNPDTLQLSGEAVPLGLKVSTSSTMISPVSASRGDVLATWSSGDDLSELVWFDRRGTRSGTAGPPDHYVDFRLAPDERRVALARVDRASNTADLGMLDLGRNFVTALTSSSQTDASPIWSSAGDRLVFRSNRRGLHELFERPALDGGGERLLHSTTVGMYPTDWSPDGRTILFHVLDPATEHDIWRLDVATRAAEPLLNSKDDEAQGQLAHGGRLAYTSDASGQLQVYVRLVDSKGLAHNVSTKGGFDPRWRADGRELFFVSPDGMMMAADISSDGLPATPRELFRTEIQPTSAPYLSDFVVTKDGGRFLVKVPIEPPGARPITVTLNWLERLHGGAR